MYKVLPLLPANNMNLTLIPSLCIVISNGVQSRSQRRIAHLQEPAHEILWQPSRRIFFFSEILHHMRELFPVIQRFLQTDTTLSASLSPKQTKLLAGSSFSSTYLEFRITLKQQYIHHIQLIDISMPFKLFSYLCPDL